MNTTERISRGIFYGRIEEQERLRGLLDSVLSARKEKQPSWSHVAVLYGLGGIGKSTLLERTRLLVTGGLENQAYTAKFAVVSIDWEVQRALEMGPFSNEHGPSVEYVLERLADACNDAKLGKYFKSYKEAASLRREAVQKLVARATAEPAGTAEPGHAGGQFAALLEVIAAPLGLPIPVGSAATLMNAAQFTRLGGEFREWAGQSLNAKEFAAVFQPEEFLTEAFAAGLHRATGKRPVLILMDTYELIRTAGPWIRRIMERVGPRCGWVIAGRLEDQEPGMAGELAAFRRYAQPDRLRVIGLHAFGLFEFAAYLQHAAPYRPAFDWQLRQLHQATRGVPLVVHAAADLWARGIPLQEIVGHRPTSASVGGYDTTAPAHILTKRLLYHNEFKGAPCNDSDYLLALAITHQTNDVELLKALWDTDDPYGVFKQLTERNDFVFTSDARLHDVAREAFREYLKPTITRSRITNANRRVIALLESRLAARNEALPTLEERADDRIWTATVSALAWHRFYERTELGWATVLAALPTAIAYNRALIQQLLAHAAYFDFDASRRERQRLDLIKNCLEVRSATSDELLNEFKRAHASTIVQPTDGCVDENSAIVEWLWACHLEVTDHHAALNEYLQAAGRLTEDHRLLRERVAAGIGRVLRAINVGRDTGRPTVSPAALVPSARVYTELQPTEPWAWFWLGYALFATDAEGALAAFERTVELSPDLTAAHTNRGHLLAGKRMHEEALAAYDRALELNPRDGKVHKSRAEILTEMYRRADAIEAYQRAVALLPEDAAAYMALGRELQLSSGRLAEALQAYERAVALAPEDPAALRAQAFILHVLGRQEEALAAYNRATELAPDHAATHYERGKLLEQMGRYIEARAALRRAAELSSYYNDASDKWRRVRLWWKS